MTLSQHEQDPETWDKPLRKELTETGAAGDAEALELAQKVLELVDSAGSNAGKYQVDARYAQGLQVGDRNQQANTFNNR